MIPSSVVLESNLRYAKYPQTVLDILRPRDSSTHKQPGVLVIHGDGWISGAREERIEYAGQKGGAEKGFVVALAEYRLANVATAPTAVEDVLQAAQWFRQHADRYNVDPRRIIVSGESAGGHLALMVGMTMESAHLGPPATVAAVVNFYGIADVADQVAGPNRRPYAMTWVPEQPGRMELARRASPLTHVRKGLPSDTNHPWRRRSNCPV